MTKPRCPGEVGIQLKEAEGYVELFKTLYAPGRTSWRRKGLVLRGRTTVEGNKLWRQG
jgi:hypothetical protein